ncbi:MAG: hypothetical protein IJ877_07640 [Candidatus Gastranaerophilales bacterium]|nr:hypothetical protein [Candidatus Gastranaerophilales bacterium]
MDKLSQLISQARPLYKQRKRRKTIAKMLFVLTAPVLLLGNIISLYMEGDAVYMSLDNNKMQNELLDDYFGISGLE